MSVPRTIGNLRDAAKLLRERGWTQGAYARDKGGEPISLAAKEACSFCMYGAIIKTSPSGTTAFDANEAVRRYICWDGAIAKWNDRPERTREQALAALEGAADMLEKESRREHR